MDPRPQVKGLEFFVGEVFSLNGLTLPSIDQTSYLCHFIEYGKGLTLLQKRDFESNGASKTAYQFQALQPGKYTITVGFAEIVRSDCSSLNDHEGWGNKTKTIAINIYKNRFVEL